MRESDKWKYKGVQHLPNESFAQMAAEICRFNLDLTGVSDWDSCCKLDVNALSALHQQLFPSLARVKDSLSCNVGCCEETDTVETVQHESSSVMSVENVVTSFETDSIMSVDFSQDETKSRVIPSPVHNKSQKFHVFDRVEKVRCGVRNLKRDMRGPCIAIS